MRSYFAYNGDTPNGAHHMPATAPTSFANLTDAACREVARAAAEALRAPVAPVRPVGCCRVYVELAGGTLRRTSRLAKALAAAGVRLTPRPGSAGVRPYVGYDNCSGAELARAEATAAAMRAAGVACLVDYDGD